jgi:hypothetical protein
MSGSGSETGFGRYEKSDQNWISLLDQNWISLSDQNLISSLISYWYGYETQGRVGLHLKLLYILEI